MTITVTTEEYRNLMTLMYSSQHLINYVKSDILKLNEIEKLDLKYLHKRMDWVTELITKIEESNEN